MTAPMNPRVRFAIQRRYEKQARKRIRREVSAVLERLGAATLGELAEATGIEKSDCGKALDALRIDGLVVEDPPGLFRWAGAVNEVLEPAGGGRAR